MKEETTKRPAHQTEEDKKRAEDAEIIEEIKIEELAIDGICGVY